MSSSYRLQWRDEDSGEVRSHATYGHLPYAEEDRDALKGQPFVSDVWIEVAEWRRVDQPSERDALAAQLDQFRAYLERMHANAERACKELDPEVTGKPADKKRFMFIVERNTLADALRTLDEITGKGSDGDH